MSFINWFKRKNSSKMSEKTAPALADRQRVWRAWFSARNADLKAQFDALEQSLIQADLGLTLTEELISTLKKSVPKNADADTLIQHLKHALHTLMAPLHDQQPSQSAQALTSILVVGINGAGKTTSIGKLGQYFKNQGAKVLLAAGDTYRAAAIEQLKVWGKRQNADVIAQAPGADSASVIFDALQAAQARQIDILIADTAGRLHTQKNLMQELEKVKRVMKKAHPDAPSEVWLVLDGTLGQSSLLQAQQFHEALELTGLIITKLDGTAKGGAVCAITQALQVPVRFVGLGEGLEDLQPFNIESFIDDLLPTPQQID